MQLYARRFKELKEGESIQVRLLTPLFAVIVSSCMLITAYNGCMAKQQTSPIAQNSTFACVST